MSNPGTKFQALVITGNPTVDSVIRYGLVAAFMFLTGAITGWLNSHGFNDPNLTLYVGTGVGAVLSAIALSVWGIIKTSKNETVAKLREAIAVQAGIAAAESPAPTPTIVTVADAQKVIADHASTSPTPTP